MAITPNERKLDGEAVEESQGQAGKGKEAAGKGKGQGQIHIRKIGRVEDRREESRGIEGEARKEKSCGSSGGREEKGCRETADTRGPRQGSGQEDGRQDEHACRLGKEGRAQRR